MTVTRTLVKMEELVTLGGTATLVVVFLDMKEIIAKLVILRITFFDF